LLCRLSINLFKFVSLSNPSTLPEKAQGSLKTDLRTFNLITFHEVKNVVGLNKLDKKNGTNLPWVIEVPLVVSLFLNDLNLVPTLLY
jgi:hypothetical protein